MTEKLTQPLVERLKKTGKQYYVRSSDRTGFAVRVSPAGRKTYTLRYRHPGAKGERDHDIALTSEMSCDAAMRKAREMRVEFDRAKEKVSTDDAPQTLFSVFEKHLQKQCQSKYKVEYIPHTEPHRRTREWPHHLQAKHRAYLRAYEYFGRDFDARKMTSLLLEEYHSKRSQVALVGANQDILLMSPAFAYLVKHKIIADNPSKYVERNDEDPDKRHIPLDRLDEFIGYLDEYANIVAASAVKFCIYTGIRKMRALELKLIDEGDNNFIDIANRVANMRDHKSYRTTKQPERIYLSNLAAETIPKRSDAHVKKNPHAFYTRDGTHISEKTFDNAFNYAKKKLKLPAALAKKITPYCTRHTFAAVTKSRTKVDNMTLAKLMSHSDTQMVEKHYLKLEEEMEQEKRRVIGLAFGEHVLPSIHIPFPHMASAQLPDGLKSAKKE